jgi:hypothetical protein
VGKLGTAELYSIAYDLNHAILAGAQDNGGIEQVGPLWAQLNPRDGVGVAVDQTSVPDSSIHYYEGDFGSFFTRLTFNSAHHPTDQHRLGLIINGTGGRGSSTTSTKRISSTSPSCSTRSTRGACSSAPSISTSRPTGETTWIG